MINEWRGKTGEDAKLQCAHIRALGRRVYLMDKKVPKGRKSLPRAHIGYLTGFDATNIYRVWVPHLKRVFRARDVWIDETVTFDPDNPHLDPLMITEIEDLIRIVEIPHLPDIAQADSNYQYEDWDDILASGLEPLSLESTQRHTTTTAPPDLRGYDQSSTPEATLPT